MRFAIRIAVVRVFYKAAAVWMGLVSFLFLATASSWLIFGIGRLAGLDLPFHRIVEVLYGAAVVSRTLRDFQRKLDANHANDGAAGEPAPRRGAGGERR